MTKEALAQFHLSSRPEEWPEVDELPQASTRLKVLLYCATVGVHFEYGHTNNEDLPHTRG